MIEYLLGNFMVNTGIITAQDFKRLLEIQDKERMKIGVLAVMKGFMTNEQTRQVHFTQMLVDKRFGEIAVEKGFLTEEQVQFLLKKQGNEYLAFIQRLIDENFISVEEADAVLYGFQIENGFSDEQMKHFREGDLESIVEMYLPVGAVDYKSIAIMAVKAVIRCIDRHAYIGQASLTESYTAKNLVIQSVSGKRGFTTGIADLSFGMHTIASVFGRMSGEILDEEVQDACAEFLNCINGLYVSDENCADNTYELEPPEIDGRHRISSDAILVLPIYMGENSFVFLVSEHI